MTVKELMEQLENISDKNIPVGVQKTIMCCGSAQTGMYEGGTECLDIKKIVLVEADTLGALTSIDEVTHLV